MSHPPLKRFLGFSEDVGDHALLGLGAEEHADTARITAALEAVLARLDRHPGARSASASIVRRRLGEAAGRLMASMPHETVPEPPPLQNKTPPMQPQAPVAPAGVAPGAATPAQQAPAPERSPGDPIPPGEATIAELTEFDRTVLAILVGSGGWNATSRGRLIGLAARRGLKPKAFMRIVSGLAQLLQDGGFERVAGTSRAIDAARVPELAPRVPTRMETTMNQVAGVLASEFRGETSGSRTRLAIAFSLMAIMLVGFFVLLLMLPSPVVEQAREQEREEALLQSLDRGIEEEPGFLPPGSGAFLSDEESTRIVELVPQAEWTVPPNFIGDRRPHEQVLKAHDVGMWISELDSIARKASLPQNADSERIRREYKSLLADGAGCWPLLEPVMRAQLVAAMVKPIASSISAPLREDMVQAIGEKLSVLEGPVDVWRASWAAGLLGTIAADTQQSEGVRAMAGQLLSIDMGSRRRSRETDETPFENLVGRKLDAMAVELLSIASTDVDGTYDAWELWFEAQAAVRRGVMLEMAWLEAILVVLRDGYALERTSKQADVLGRLVSEVDFSSQAMDPELVRMNVRSWLEDETIPAENLWVLSSMMAQSLDVPWWDAVLVLAPTASVPRRLELANAIEAAWPSSVGRGRPRGILVPASALRRLESAQDRLAGMDSATTNVGGMYRLLASARVTAAAEALEMGDTELALDQLASAEVLLQEPFSPKLRPAHLVGERARSTERDGPWTEQWIRTRRDVDERQTQLRRIKQREGGDLGPVDAATLAKEAFRGTPREVRLLAQEVVIDAFPVGPNMLVALLDQFEFAPRNQDTVDFLQRLTAANLPPLSDDSWREASRLALVQHAYDVQETTLHDVDRLAEWYAEILRSRLERLDEGTYLRQAQPQVVAGALVDIIQRRAESQFVTEPFPASLEELDRRRSVRWTSANGPAQQLAAELSALADLAAYETSGMRPDLRRRLVEEHEELTSRVAVAPNVLEQILLLEEAIGRLFTMRLEAEGGAG